MLRVLFFFFFQAEDGIRDLVRSRGLGDVYKRQQLFCVGDDWQSIYGFRGSDVQYIVEFSRFFRDARCISLDTNYRSTPNICLLYTSDAADERSSVDLGGRRIIKKKKKEKMQDIMKCVEVKE